ncbi:hypothetical protein STRNI_000956 [Streptomyces nigrescens]|uniref:Uncharacterized protein n=1 Tax=Streptomyces nigrescens TaxID=1920 RepID=A0ABY7JID9_STRNI|nr:MULTISPECIES: hypothetical protein [Streptomyces]WAU09927.1 hypothetical protein STRNI_000956 [Streptomyces nigrescens]WDT60295.1 hypothetical protein NUT86_36755 [Streptomyces sp. G7(2002)]
MSIAGEVDLAGQPAAGASESAVFEPPLAAVCWWARTIVEPIATSQSTSACAERTGGVRA